MNFFIAELFFLRFYLFLERREGRKIEMERNISVWEKHQWVASHTAPTQELAGNPGMSSDWELNQRLLRCTTTPNLLSHTS